MKNILKNIETKEWLWSLFWIIIIFTFFGFFTAIWDNQFFVRMTPTNNFDWFLLASESILLGLYFGLKSRENCSTNLGTIGVILGFLGFGCALCNKLLLLLIGSVFITQYFEPIRPFLGVFGILLLSYALLQKIKLHIT